MAANLVDLRTQKIPRPKKAAPWLLTPPPAAPAADELLFHPVF